MEEKSSRNAETKHTKCCINSVEVLQFLRIRVGLDFSPHGYSVQAFQPQIDHHFSIPFKIFEWGKQYVILLHPSCTPSDIKCIVPSMQALNVSRKCPKQLLKHS